jgi:6,7-dimethyl-8-ribityllumazine synthase
MNIAIIISKFNQEITSLMEINALERAKELNISPKIYKVPGAIEIPIIAQNIAKKNNFDAIIALGAVIRGETSHYDYVCESVNKGCQKISLKYNIPVIFGILTCENKKQALDRIGGIKGNKPKEMIDVAVEMISLLKAINE